MAFSGGLGMDIFLPEAPYKNKYSPQALRSDFILFSESNSRFLVEVNKNDKKDFEKILKANSVPFGIIGCLNRSGEFKVWGFKEQLCVKAGLGELKEAWQRPLRW
jgi:phosphoribosylformylglycinamidine synthase